MTKPQTENWRRQKLNWICLWVSSLQQFQMNSSKLGCSDVENSFVFLMQTRKAKGDHKSFIRVWILRHRQKNRWTKSIEFVFKWIRKYLVIKQAMNVPIYCGIFKSQNMDVVVLTFILLISFRVFWKTFQLTNTVENILFVFTF